MTPEELLKLMSNHTGEVREIMKYATTFIESMSKGYVPVSNRNKDVAKDLLEIAREKIKEIKGYVGELE